MGFLDGDFLLTTGVARALYHEYAEALPIIDYHCHLSPDEIAGDECFSGIVEAWLGAHGHGDHYKWRLMRANGVPEDLVSGDADDWEKFQAFAGTIAKAAGNPVHLWTHLELRRIFGIDEELTPSNARRIFDRTNELLAAPEFSRRNLIRRAGVEVVCTTDDPVDDLRFHRELASERSFRVVPTFRPDQALAVESPGYGTWLRTLETVAGVPVTDVESLVEALSARADAFHEAGARLSDHAVGELVDAEATTAELDGIMERARAGAPVSPAEAAQYRTGLLTRLMRLNVDHGWTMQLHIHASRNLNGRRFAAQGSDTGYDALSDAPLAAPLARLLDGASQCDILPDMILYSLNPNDWLVVATVMGCFQGGTVQRLQLGNAWWFNDTRSGIRRQLQTMAEQSLIGNFVGMTTDSRSFLSYPRHEFFRRILCELLGEWAERGEVPSDPRRLGPLVRAICYGNAKRVVSGAGARSQEAVA